MRKKATVMATAVGACLILTVCSRKPAPPASDGSSDIDARIDLIENVLARRRDAARLLSTIASGLPERVWLAELAFDAGEARIKGFARSNILLFDFLSRLERSAELAEVNLESSTRRSSRGGETFEFVIRIVLGDLGSDIPPASGPPTDRLEELEKFLPQSGETAEFFRQYQRRASDAGLQMTKFQPAATVRGDLYGEWSAVIEVMGDHAALRRFFNSLADLPHVWVVEKLSFKALSAGDSRSPIRASIEGRTLLRD